ncbi:hypothetical protein ACHAWU_008574 [Discostella pseudostelligera]|uniref:Uncharacterized protein n=1 Tax=Discostella pseudostelligera TaxID=259834 RepID=A0ABD3M681_9STRA
MILYAVIARAKDGVILVESTVAGVGGNFPQITVEVLERVVVSSKQAAAAAGGSKGRTASPPPNGGNASSQEELLPCGARRTFAQHHETNTDSFFPAGLFSGISSHLTSLGINYDHGDDIESNNNTADDVGYYFHLYRKDNKICLCISDDTDVRQHAINYSFLDDAENKFSKSYAAFQVTKAKAYGMEKNFSKELGKLIYFYNENRSTMDRQEKVNVLLNKVDDLKSIMGRNIDMVLEREGKLVELVEQSDSMLKDTKVFTKRSSKLKTRSRRENMAYIAVGVVFAFMVVWIFLESLFNN